jgi:hypothetical protein
MGTAHAQGKRAFDFVFAGHPTIQTGKHHWRHYTDPKNSHYCTITNTLKPILDPVRFWDGLEWLPAKTIHLHRQPDTSARACGPGPAWLPEFRHPAMPPQVRAN